MGRRVASLCVFLLTLTGWNPVAWAGDRPFMATYEFVGTEAIPVGNTHILLRGVLSGHGTHLGRFVGRGQERGQEPISGVRNGVRSGKGSGPNGTRISANSYEIKAFVDQSGSFRHAASGRLFQGPEIRRMARKEDHRIHSVM